MRRVSISILSVGLIAFSQPALSFQEEHVGTSPDGVVVEKLDIPAGAAFESTNTNKAKEEGTVVNIPGLGRLGVLPKMDFGLELLYGAAESEQSIETKDNNDAGLSTSEDGDLRIRGTLKHRF